MTTTTILRFAVTDDEKSSSSDAKRSQYTTKYTQAHYELNERFHIVFASPRPFFPFRCMLEHCVRIGITVPGIDPKELRTPRIGSEKTTARAVTDLFNYASWFAVHVRSSKRLRLQHAVRLRLISRLARWPQRDLSPWQTPSASTAIDVSNYRSPQNILVPVVYDEAIKEAAVAAGSFAELVRTAMDTFAAEHDFAAPGTMVPTFQRFPAPPLVTIQRSLEEPALAVLYAMHVLDQRPATDKAVLPPSPELHGLLEAVVRLNDTQDET